MPLSLQAHNSHLPIHTLPDELLLEIFSADIEASASTAYMTHDRPYDLTCVCRLWNSLIMAEARFWRHIHLRLDYLSYSSRQHPRTYHMAGSDPVQLPFLPPRVQTSLVRSLQSPLGITLSHKGDLAVRDALPLLNAVQDRIQSLRIENTWSLQELIPIVPFRFTSPNVGKLKHITVINHIPTNNVEPMFASRQRVLTMQLRWCRAFDYSCFSADGLVEASFEMLDFDDRAAAFLSSASNLRVLGWKGGANATQTFDDFIYLPSLTILSLGTRPDTGDFDRITTSWFCTYINAPNLLHLDFVISQDIQEVLSWLIDEDQILAFPSVQSLRIFGTFSEVSLQTDVEGGAQSVEDLERAFVLFVASFPALKSLLIAVVNPDPKRRQELPKFTSLISHPPPGIVLFPQLRNIYIGYWCSFNNLWRSTSAASHDAIMNSLLPLRRGASFAIPTGGQVTGVPEDPVVRICPTAQHFNTVVIEGGALLRVLPEVKIELLTLGVVVEDPSWETGPWLMALGGWDVLQEFSERLQVRVLLESGWRANESR